MEGIRGKIVKELLYKIEINMDTAAVDNSVAVFSEFIKALVLEADMLNPDAGVDESAKQQAEEAADAHMRDLSILFQLSGDHQKEVDEIFARMATSMTAKVTESENEANLLPVKGQEFHIYTGEPPSAFNQLPEGTLLCKAIFGDTVTIRSSGKASYGLLVKDNQYVDCIGIDTIPAKGKMSVASLEFHQGCYFTIDNW